jgi:hypothetical protein
MDLQTFRYVAACQICSSTINRKRHKSANNALRVESIEHVPLFAAQGADRFITASNAVVEGNR